MTARKRIPARARKHQQHKPGQMNKTEAAYAEHLKRLQLAGEVHHWWFEAVKLRVAYDECWIVFDFAVQLPDGMLELHDVKGGPTEGDALIKMKTIATLYPFRVCEVRLRKGHWVYTEIEGTST